MVIRASLTVGFMGDICGDDADWGGHISGDFVFRHIIRVCYNLVRFPYSEYSISDEDEIGHTK